MAAIVVSGVSGLIYYDEAVYIWRVHKFDFCVWIIAFVGTLFLGVQIGLAIAVAVSLSLVIYESAFPHTALLGRLPGTTVYRNVKQYPDAECYDGIVMVRVDAPIYFANAQNVRDSIRKYEECSQKKLAARNLGTVKFVIIDVSPVSYIDTTGLHVLLDMTKAYQCRKIQLCFCNPNTLVMHQMVLGGLVNAVGREHFFVTMHEAVYQCLKEMDEEVISSCVDGNHQGSSADDQDSAGITQSLIGTQEVTRSSFVSIERTLPRPEVIPIRTWYRNVNQTEKPELV